MSSLRGVSLPPSRSSYPARRPGIPVSPPPSPRCIAAESIPADILTHWRSMPRSRERRRPQPPTFPTPQPPCRSQTWGGDSTSVAFDCVRMRRRVPTRSMTNNERVGSFSAAAPPKSGRERRLSCFLPPSIATSHVCNRSALTRHLTSWARTILFGATTSARST